MITRSPGLIAAAISTIGMGLIFISSIDDIEHSRSPVGLHLSHVYLIAFAIIIAGGLIADAIQRRKD